jgi:hypothetical protein
MCTAALNGMTDPNEMRAFMDRVFTALSTYTPGQQGLEGDGTHGDMAAVVAALTTMVQTFDARYLGSPPPGTSLTDWIDTQTRAMGSLAWEWAKWIYTSDQSNINNAVFARQFEEGILAAAALALIPTGGVGLTVAAGVIEAALTGWLVPAVDSALNSPAPDPQAAELNFVSAQEAYAKFMVTAQLFGEGQLVMEGPNGPEPITLSTTGCSSEDQLLLWVLQHPDQVLIKGTSQTLTSVLDGVGNSYSPHPDT